MKKVIGFFLVAFLITSVAIGGDPWRKITRVFSSVQPLLYEGQFSCSSFLIDYEKGTWITAGHCVDYPGYRTIDGKPIEVISRSALTDLAALKLPVMPRRALKLADTPARIGDQLAIVGFNQLAYDNGMPQIRKLILLFPPMRSVTLVERGLYDFGIPLLVTFEPIGGTMGMSGAPVLNRDFEVVGVHVAGFLGPVRGEIPLEDIKAFVAALP